MGASRKHNPIDDVTLEETAIREPFQPLLCRVYLLPCVAQGHDVVDLHLTAGIGADEVDADSCVGISEKA